MEIIVQAADSMQNEHRIEIVPGATHLFEEPCKLEKVAQLARDWFQQHLGAAEPDPPEARSSKTGIFGPRAS